MPRLLIIAALIPVVALAQGVETQPPRAHDHPAGQEGPMPEGSELNTASAGDVSTVKEALASTQDDQEIVLRGRILKHIKGEDYIFSDRSGQIQIEIDDDDYPRERIALNSEVEIRGELDVDQREPVKIEVDDISPVRTQAR